VGCGVKGWGGGGGLGFFLGDFGFIWVGGGG